MGKKKIEQDLRAAGLRKKRARNVAKAADRARAGDRGSTRTRRAAVRRSPRQRFGCGEVCQTADVEINEDGIGEEGFCQADCDEAGVWTAVDLQANYAKQPASGRDAATS